VSETRNLDTRTTIVLNPLRSEEEAFRALLYLIAVLAVIVGLVFALRALI
jgi:flagellar biogenesis protein FliO